MPYFSIVIAARNAEKTLPKTLASVKHQRFTDFEVIVINDGSTDGTLQVLKDFKTQLGDKFEYRNQRNKGLGNARNRGIQVAKGIFIALLDADDTWEPNKLEELFSFTEKKPDVEAVFHQITVLRNGKRYKRKAYLPKTKEELLTKGNPITPSAFAMRGEVFKSFNFSEKTEFHGAEDLHLWIKLYIAQTKFAYLPKALTVYHAGVGMSSRLGEHLRHVENVLEYYHKGDDISKKVYKMALRRKRYEAARYCHKRGNYTKAEDYYVAAQDNSLKVLLLRLFNFLGIAI